MIWLKRAALLVGTVVVLLGVAELAMRAMPGTKDADFFKVTPWLKDDFYRLADDVGYEIIPRVSEQVNSLGMRGPERPEAKPPGGLRVLVLGDSVAYGVGVSMTQNFSARLEGLLRERMKGRYVDVLDAGVSGYNTVQELAKLENRGLALQPDVVVLSYCPNDIACTPMLFKQGDRFCFYTGSAQPRSYPAALIERSALFRRAVVAREALFRDETTKERSRDANLEALKRMTARLKERGIPLLVVIFPYLLDQLTKYPPVNVKLHQEVKRIVTESGGGVIDLLDVWRDRDYRTLRNRLDKDDYVHPNEDGHLEAARLMADWIGKTLGPP